MQCLQLPESPAKLVERSRNLLDGNQPVRAVVRDLRKGEAWLRPRVCGYQ